jgi:thiamine transporter
MGSQRTRIIVEAGLTIALAYVLGRFMIFKLPFGGAVSLDMLPLLVFALRRGAWPGVLTGALYGLLNYTIDVVPVVHWVQFLLDYAVAYGLVGIAGFGARALRDRAAAGAIRQAMFTVMLPFGLMAMLARFAAHFVSGIVFFGMYAPAGQPVVLYSLIYNLTYMGPSAVLCLAATAAVLPVLEKAVPAR